MKVVLTNSHGYFDGAGAQVQRILSLVALSRYMGFEFRLNQILKVELQPLEREGFAQSRSSEIDALNIWLRKFETPGDRDEGLDFDCVDNLKDLLKTISQNCFRVMRRNKEVKVIGIALLDGYSATNCIPDIWNYLHESQTDEAQRITHPGTVSIHVHFRSSTFSESSDRNLPVEYYRMLIERLINQNRSLGIIPKLFIHTDFFGQPVSSDELQQQGVPESLLYWQEMNLVDDQGNVNHEFVESSRIWLKQFLKRFENVTYVEESDWISEWESMASADYLIASKSSFSLIGGLLNAHGKVFAPTNWGIKLKNWTLVDPKNVSTEINPTLI